MTWEQQQRERLWRASSDTDVTVLWWMRDDIVVRDDIYCMRNWRINKTASPYHITRISHLCVKYVALSYLHHHHQIVGDFDSEWWYESVWWCCSVDYRHGSHRIFDDLWMGFGKGRVKTRFFYLYFLLCFICISSLSSPDDLSLTLLLLLWYNI